MQKTLPTFRGRQQGILGWIPSRRSVLAEEGRRLAILKDYSVGIEEPEAADRVKLQLALEDVTSLRLRTTANRRPVLARQTRLLNLKLGGHDYSPSLIFSP
jgi:hypothetical protein